VAQKIAILHQAVSSTASKDEEDTLEQVAVVRKALRTLGHRIVEIPVTLDLAKARNDLASAAPSIVFNLVESLEGRGEFIHFATGLLDSMRIPYTGASSEALFLTSHKLIAKAMMLASRIPTPAWAARENVECNPAAVFLPCIIKNVWEHASIGIDDNAVVSDARALPEKVAERSGRIFFEQYIDGREFNLSLLASQDGPRVLPPAEICFLDFPEGKPKIVGYEAKWESDSFEFKNTPRTFEFQENDKKLLDRLKKLALLCWQTFALSGYARVDFRVDGALNPWVLEINANPCLSPDAGYFEAAQRAGLNIESLVALILQDALDRHAKKG
jgi:D-alanine-D-alanine ligase